MKKTITLLFLLGFAIQVNSQIFNAGFENNNGTPLSEFTTINNDGLLVPFYAPVLEFDTEAWIQFYDAYDNKIAFSTSWYDPEGQSDDWLITPSIEIPNDGQPTLYWKGKSYDFENLEDYDIRVSVTDIEMGSFSDTILSVTGEQAFDFYARSVDLSAYKGQSIYIAFVNVTNAGYFLALDDLYISGSEDCILPEVMDVASSNLRESGFTVNWSATDGISSYDTGLTTFTESVSSTGTQTELTKTYSDLAPATRYQFFLKNDDCGSGWATPTSVWTAAVLPYSYDFEFTEENYGEYDSDGWTSNTWINGEGESAQNGMGYVFNNTSKTSEKNDWIFSYPIKLEEGETMVIEFFGQMSLEWADEAILKVSVATAPNINSNFEVLNSFNITGGDYQEYSSEFTASESGVYYVGFGNVTPIIEENASLRLDNFRFSMGSLSVEDQTISNISIYPNPVNDILFIHSEKAINDIEIYSINGRLIESLSKTNAIDFTSYSKGIYLVKLITADGSVVKKVVK